MCTKINYVLKKYPKIDLQFSVKSAAHLRFRRTKSDMEPESEVKKLLKRFYKEAPSIRRLTHTLLDSNVTSEDCSRDSPSFTDPTTIGHKKIGTTTLVKDTLQRSSCDDLEVDDSGDQLMNLNYELSDVV